MKKKLEKFYTRKRSLIFVHLWDKGDRKVFEFFNIELKTILFIGDGKGNISVYYDLEEMENALKKMELIIKENPRIIDEVVSLYKKHWNSIFPYLEGIKKIKDNKEFEDVFENVVEWGVAFNILYFIPNFQDIPKKYIEIALNIRKENDKYTELLDDIWLDYFRGKIDEKFIKIVTPKEAVSIMDGDFKEEEYRKIEDRLNGFVFFENKLILPKNLEETLSEKEFYISEEAVSDDLIISGSSAYKGIVKGKVRVIETENDLSNFLDGEILVTHMTQPSFLPAMKKAVAFVTDEGGVTCHAAIVAREMKKPCVIGTKIATKVLKDGDLIEVDANEGVVRLLEKNS